MAGLRRFWKEGKGQALVETALILPLLLVLLFGIVEFGRVFNAYLVTSQASREGARVAALGSNDLQAAQAARDAAGIFDPADVVVDIQPGGPRDKGKAVSVVVSYDLELFAPLITAVLPNPLTVTGSTVMRVE